MRPTHRPADAPLAFAAPADDGRDVSPAGAAVDATFELLYAELRALARRQLAREAPGHTLDSAALVHEAYLRLRASPAVAGIARAAFVAVAARAMRRVLVDHARARLAEKRRAVVPLAPGALADAPAPEPEDRLVALDEALQRLASVDGEAARTVECRYFGGLTLEETAPALGVSVATVRRRWSFAKAWLRRELGPAPDD